MAPSVETPPRAERPADGRAPRTWKGDDAVPRGLAVASAVVLRAAIVVGGVILVALGAAKLMLVVLPVIIAVLVTTLLAPPTRWLERHGWRPAAAAFATTLLAVLVFFGLWALIIPGVLSQSDELVASVQEGAGEAIGVLEPLGVGRADVERAIDEALAGVQGTAVADEVLTGAVLVTKWAAAVVLIVGVPVATLLIVLTFVAAFFPILGAFAAGSAAVLVALVANGLVAALIILAVIVAVQQLEGNVFYPVVVGRKLHLHPVGILLALTAGGVLAGVAGAFLAVPVAAAGAAVLDFNRERREAREPATVLTP